MMLHMQELYFKKMSNRKRQSRKVRLTEVLPIWTNAQSDTANMVFMSVFLKFGITDIESYFQRLRFLIAICVFAGALCGASVYGLKGFFFGGILGLSAPAVVLWLGVMLVLIFMYLAFFAIAWGVIFFLLWWLMVG